MEVLSNKFESAEEARAFTLKCEQSFEKKLRAAARRALEKENRIITLSGPTCSGKTTTAALLEEEIEASVHNAVTISIDDFYLDNLRSSTPEGQVPDFDSAKTIDLNYLSVFIDGLRRGERVMVPKFDFLSGVRVGYSELIPDERDIFVFEGIQAVYPEVTSLFGDSFTSIFTCVMEDVSIDGVLFTSHEVRLLRRTVRDYLFRNATPDFTLKCWDSVRSNEEKSIFPNIGNTDIFIDSFLPYELYVIGKFATPLFETVAHTDSEYLYAHELIARLSKITNEHFLTEFVPKSSMFREFIGKE